jgi:hypothetical protein
MFEHLSQYRVIIVTGPMRSGTTICGHMIAADTGKAYYDDAADLHFQPATVRRLVDSGAGVLQYPQPWGIEAYDRPDVAIIMMRRSLADIRASHARLGVARDGWQLGQYMSYRQRTKYFPEAQYMHWDEVQQALIAHAFDVQYESLSQHPLWVAPETRRACKTWGTKTWRLEVTA